MVNLLHEPMRLQARRRPDHPAVRDQGRSFSFHWIDEHADALASTLIECGIGPGDCVAMLLDKSWHAIVAMHGILRSGAAYVPIDPKGPSTRSAEILADARCAMLIAGVETWDRLRLTGADLTATHVVIVHDEKSPEFDGTPTRSSTSLNNQSARTLDWIDATCRRDSVPVVAIVESDLAYVLYTSGTTGRPKGVEVTHRNAVAFVAWAVDALGLHEGDIHSQHAPLRFDLSILDIFAPSFTGGTVALVPERATLFASDLANWIRSEAITVWYSVPTALSMLVRVGAFVSPTPCLRLVLFAGEELSPVYLATAVRELPHVTFANLYGPTETNVCTYHVVESGFAGEGGGSVPIGRPCEHTRGRVVSDDQMVLSHAGAVGELIISGPTVARGYRGHVGTGGFVAPGTYQTGDLVEIIEPGERPLLRFVGRRDTMVKVRGYRVELGEIEAILQEAPGVRHAIVVPIDDERIGVTLLAYCVVDGDASESDLQQKCRERLPRYMVPARFVFIEDAEIPLTETGKTDRSALAKLALRTSIR